MKRAICVLATLVAVCGCGKSQTPALEPVTGQASADTDNKARMGSPNPQAALEALPPKERAEKIREYGKTWTNKTMLKSQIGKFTTDSDPEVAAAAKEALGESTSN